MIPKSTDFRAGLAFGLSFGGVWACFFALSNVAHEVDFGRRVSITEINEGLDICRRQLPDNMDCTVMIIQVEK